MQPILEALVCESQSQPGRRLSALWTEQAPFLTPAPPAPPSRRQVPARTWQPSHHSLLAFPTLASPLSHTKELRGVTPEAGRATHLELVGDQLGGPAWCCPAPSTVWEREAGPAKPTRCGPGSSARAQHPQAPRPPITPLRSQASSLSGSFYAPGHEAHTVPAAGLFRPSTPWLLSSSGLAPAHTWLSEHPGAPPAPPRPGSVQ